MGSVRFGIVALLVLVILLLEYDWLTTPWWQKTLAYCGSTGWDGLLRDLRGWLGW